MNQDFFLVQFLYMWTLAYQENSAHIYDIFNSHVLYGSPELCPSKYNQFVFPIIF